MKQNLGYNKTVLEDGLRVISEKMPSARSIALGVWIDVGSRDELSEENGISHFVEHMMFKGTKNRSTKEIASSLESLGGSLNAFTSREQTCFHAYVLDEHLNEAIDVLGDIIMNSTFSPTNLEREKLVVIEEIHEVEETPSENIHELFYECFWRGQPIGRPIMGSAGIISSLRRTDLTTHVGKHYRAGRVVVTAAGNVSHRRLVSLVKKKFRFSAGSVKRGEGAASPGGISIKFFKNKSNQNHICLGFPGIKFDDPARNVLNALNAYLGGGMSSVLFQKIREEKGIAYTVYTFVDLYRDNGLVGAYLAAEKNKLKLAVEIILKELKKVKKERLPKHRLQQIKSQMKGNLVLGMESTMTRMNRLGRYELLCGRNMSLDETLQAVDRITSDNIIEAARRIFNHENMTVTSLGPAERQDLADVDWSML